MQSLKAHMPTVARATREFQRRQTDDWGLVELKVGDIVHVVDQNIGEDGWWHGVVNGRASGRFPSSHVKVLGGDEVPRTDPRTRGCRPRGLALAHVCGIPRATGNIHGGCRAHADPPSCPSIPLATPFATFTAATKF